MRLLDRLSPLTPFELQLLNLGDMAPDSVEVWPYYMCFPKLNVILGERAGGGFTVCSAMDKARMDKHDFRADRSMREGMRTEWRRVTLRGAFELRALHRRLSARVVSAATPTEASAGQARA